MNDTLSPRLSALLTNSLPGGELWDICCDHGYLGMAGMRANFSRVIFVDRVPHIIESLKIKAGKYNRIYFLALSAEEINEPITGTVVIAGVGSYNVIKILEAWSAKGILHADRLVLNPMSHVKALRAFLEAWTPYFEKETVLVREGTRDREIIILERRA